jgi:hypothetical protein
MSGTRGSRYQYLPGKQIDQSVTWHARKDHMDILKFELSLASNHKQTSLTGEL